MFSLYPDCERYNIHLRKRDQVYLSFNYVYLLHYIVPIFTISRLITQTREEIYKSIQRSVERNWSDFNRKNYFNILTY